MQWDSLARVLMFIISMHTDLPLRNLDFKIIMYGAVHELKVPFLLALIQTLTNLQWHSLARVLMFIV